MLKQNNKWCPEIYRGLYIDRYNDDCVRVAPCCQAHTSIESLKDFNFVTSPHLNKLRSQFEKGEQPKECHRCWIDEELGTKSRRQVSIEDWNQIIGSNEVVLESLDHSATWACNLACVMCNERISSGWASEIGSNKQRLLSIGRLIKKNKSLMDIADLRKLKKLHFNGGEPLINNDHVEVLEKLSQLNILKDITISYNTNGTFMPNAKTIDLWKQSRLVRLFISVDATDTAYNYIRYPADWRQITQNVIDMKLTLPSNVLFGINVTVGSYNIFDIDSVYEWFKDTISSNREGDPSIFNCQIAFNLDPKHLSADIKQVAIERLRKIDVYQGIVAYLETHINDVSNDEWISWLDQIDRRRGTSWKKSLHIGVYY